MTELELFLNEIGIVERAEKEEPKPKNPTREKGYFDDPRDENGEVPF
jgi:hypothetical protein